MTALKLSYALSFGLALAALPLVARAEPAAGAVAAAPADSPGPWLKATVERAKKLAERKVKADTPAEEAWKKDVKAAIDDVVDWGELTQRSLGKTWDARTPAERDEFAKLLRAIVEASYEARLRQAAHGEVKEPAKIDIIWGEEKITGATAIARAQVKADKDGASLEFALKKVGATWRIFDVTIDDVSTLRTYRSQFNKIIAEKGFPELIERMKKKVEDVKAGKGL